jgi:hypothetical protein
MPEKKKHHHRDKDRKSKGGSKKHHQKSKDKASKKHRKSKSHKDHKSRKSHKRSKELRRKYKAEIDALKKTMEEQQQKLLACRAALKERISMHDNLRDSVTSTVLVTGSLSSEQRKALAEVGRVMGEQIERGKKKFEQLVDERGDASTDEARLVDQLNAPGGMIQQALAYLNGDAGDQGHRITLALKTRELSDTNPLYNLANREERTYCALFIGNLGSRVWPEGGDEDEVGPPTTVREVLLALAAASEIVLLLHEAIKTYPPRPREQQPQRR